ncbi:protein kinase, partial [Gemmatimonadota bacterium]
MIGESVGRYRIVEQIGKGGMGVVYRAEDTELNRSVALKFLSEKAIKSDQEMARFVREAQAAASLDHANICPVYEIGQYGDMPYIAMPFIEGQSLKEKIKNDFMSVQEVVDLGLQIAIGLDEAHTCGVIHRDIKSENIMITVAGQAKIMDFGLAKLADQSGHTPSGYTLGTIAYLSPEQARGELVDQKTDIWSFGVVLYEMITGQLPFNKDTEAGMVYAILSDSPLAPSELRSDLPRELERITYRALRKRQSDRYQLVSEMITDLQALKRSFEEAAWSESVTVTGKEEPRKETEHRFATIMYADIVGYSVLIEEQDPEEVTRIMNRCFESFDLIARKYGGRIDTILESNITALFGVPQAVENSPRAAINTAIEWLTATHQLNADENLGHFLDLKIGINSGPVIAGMMGPDRRVEYSAVGTTTILASELKGLAEESQILAGAATYQQAKDFRQLKPVTRKGWKEPIQAFEMLTRVPVLQATEMRMGSGIYSDLVGRGEELEQLEFHVHKVIHGEGSIVNLIGEAGVGKSRLIDELEVAKVVERVTFLQGRALSIGQYLSYHPIIDILKSWADIKEEDSEAASLAKLERVVHDVDPDESLDIFPFIATLMGMRLSGRYAERIRGIEGEALENLIMKSLTDLLIKGSEQGPIVFVVHDAHWADQTSIEVLESLFRLSDRHPILFINVLRPDYPETSDRLLESIKDRYGTLYNNIHLHRLTEDDSQILIRNLFNSTELPEVIQKAITDRTEGNPYFIEEVVRSLLDQGVVKVESGILRLREDIDSLHIPETIQDLLMTRIDRLDESTRNLLKEASVIGRYFFFKILEEMNQALDQEAISEHLSTLLQFQLIRKSARQEELEYLFKHALAHDVTYDSIPPNKRKELHLKVAGAIEAVFLERLHEFYGMLALHYSNAEEPDKAEEYLERAGEVALKAAASIEALTYFQKALNIYQREHGESADPAKIATLEENIGIALYNKGKMQECVPYFDRVLEHLGEAKSRVRIDVPEGKKSPGSNLVEIGRLRHGEACLDNTLHFCVFSRTFPSLPGETDLSHRLKTDSSASPAARSRPS